MDATSITFEIPGAPVPQPRARATRQGRMYTPTTNGIDTYKDAICLSATSRARLARWERTSGPHYVHVEAVFARPTSHYRASGDMRPDAPTFPGKRCGDLDNIEKGVWDAITRSAAIWDDDTQVVEHGGRKRYADPGEAARTIVTIRRLPG